MQTKHSVLEDDNVFEDIFTESVTKLDGRFTGRDINLEADNLADALGIEKGSPLVFHDNCIKHTTSDEFIYEDTVEEVHRFQRSIQKGQDELPTFDRLHQDLFYSMYKYKPEMIAEEEMKPSAKMNHKIMSQLVESEDFQTLRQNCHGDIYNSVLGVEMLGNRAMEVFMEWKREAEENQDPNQPNMSDIAQMIQQMQQAENQLQQAQDAAQSIQEVMDQMAQNGQQIPEAVNQAHQNSMMNQQMAQQFLDEVSQQAEQAMEQNQKSFDQLQRGFAQAAQDLNREIDETNDLINSWGLEPGDASRIPMENKREAIERIRASQKLKKMTEMIGNLKTVAREEQKRKSKDGATTIKTIEIGNKIESVLPSEKMKLIHPTMKKDFYRRYNQKELLQYQKESFNNKAKGPIICCIDTSGSMSGTAEVWSKAMAIAMLEIAQKQKRDFCAILYCSRVDAVIHFERDKFNPTDVVELAERFSGGGTNFQKPLDKCLELIKTSKYKKADIVFITDGDCGLDNSFVRKFNNAKEEKEFFCKGIVIDGYSHTSTIEKFCDDVTYISDMAVLEDANSDEARGVFRGL